MRSLSARFREIVILFFHSGPYSGKTSRMAASRRR
jgi:hypothetical protein